MHDQENTLHGLQSDLEQLLGGFARHCAHIRYNSELELLRGSTEKTYDDIVLEEQQRQTKRLDFVKEHAGDGASRS